MDKRFARRRRTESGFTKSPVCGQQQSDDSVHVTLYSIAVLSLCALLVGVIAAAATHVAMKQKSVQMLERSKAPWQSYGSRDEEGAPLIAKRPSLSFSV